MGRLRSFFERLFGTSAPAGPDDARVPAYVVVGLGNPGPQYARTRHNAGFLVLERLAARQEATWCEDAALEAQVAWITVGDASCLLLAPQTFMNRSGRSVEAVLERWSDLEPERDLVVVYDDLDLPTGRIRLRPSGGAGGHRGMGDIQTVLATKSLRRLRFGVGHPGESGQAVVDYVLAPFPEPEQEALEVALERAADAVAQVVAGDFATVMGQFNAK